MFKGPKEVHVGDQVLTAKHILIATGTKPVVPSTTDVPGKNIANVHVSIIACPLFKLCMCKEC